MRRILIATSNPGKLRDFAGAAAAHGVEVAGIPSFSSLPPVVEDGDTFEANARKKAETYSRHVPGEIVIADDSGLEVDALNGAPGVHSARYAADQPQEADANTDDEANNARVLRELRSFPPEKRSARFVCVLVAARDGKTLATFRGEAEGIILEAPRGSNGFGYDPLFYFPQIKKTFAELTAEEKSKYSHRGAAFRLFLDWYLRFLSQSAFLQESASARSLALPSALIFDMDGVLVDSEPLHKRAKEEAFRRFGIVLPESVYDSYKGRPDATMMQEVLEERGQSALLDELLRVKHQIFESIEHDLQPIPGAVDFLRWAKSHYRVLLATSATPRNRAAALEVLGVSDLFEAVVDSGQFQRPKPDPEIFLVAMKRLGLAAEECWVIEVSLNGVKAAKAAGCVVAAITTTFESALLTTAGADLIVSSFAELRGKLQK